MTKQRIIIVGAGMTGIAAARTLMEHGYQEVCLVEKSKSIGGRMATRRIGDGQADHGAQFFTARTEAFQGEIDKWVSRGWAKPWFGERYTRYMSPLGMNGLAKKWGADIPVKLNTKVTQLKQEEAVFRLTTEQGEVMQADAVIVTLPAPQALSILNAPPLSLSTDVLEKLESISFQPALVAIVTLETASLLPSDGHLDQQLPDGILRVVDHKRKGISKETVVSIYMTGDWSVAHQGLSDDAIIDIITKKSQAYVRSEKIVSSQLKRWRFAEAVTFLNQPYLDTGLEQPLFIAGDAFLRAQDDSGKTRLESAYLSGVDVAKALMSRFERG